MSILVFWAGPEYAGQAWWDGQRARWDGPDPLNLQGAMRLEWGFPPDDALSSDPDMRHKLASVRRRISSEDDLGVLGQLAANRGADVERVESDSAPIDPKSTPHGKRIHGAPPAHRRYAVGSLPATDVRAGCEAGRPARRLDTGAMRLPG